MKEKLILVILVFSLTVNAAALLTIGYFWGKNNTGREPGPPPFGAELSLDQGQRDRMRELRTSFINETAPFRDDLMIKRAELAQLLEGERRAGVAEQDHGGRGHGGDGHGVEDTRWGPALRAGARGR